MTMILVIDDDIGLSQSLVEILGLEGWQVMEASDGIAGTKMALQYRPDLILCDVNLPLLDGYGVLQTLRLDEHTAHIPFLLMTAAANLPQFKQQGCISVDCIIAKPFSVPAMLDKIRRWLPQ